MRLRFGHLKSAINLKEPSLTMIFPNSRISYMTYTTSGSLKRIEIFRKCKNYDAYNKNKKITNLGQFCRKKRYKISR